LFNMKYVHCYISAAEKRLGGPYDKWNISVFCCDTNIQHGVGRNTFEVMTLP